MSSSEKTPLLDEVASTSEKDVKTDSLIIVESTASSPPAPKSPIRASRHEFPENANSFHGYAFTKTGYLLQIADGQRFAFTTQQEYEEVGNWISEEIFRMLQNEPYNLEKIIMDDQLPDLFDDVDLQGSPPKHRKADGSQKKDEEKYSFVFASKDLKHAQHLVVIIHGTGVVRAGQWSRKLIMNQSLDIGSQLPYIRECQKRGWAVLVMNTNDNYYYVRSPQCSTTMADDSENHKEELEIQKHAKVEKEQKRKLNSGTAEKHGLFVWEHLIQKLSYANHTLKIAIVAHSYGGLVTMEILSHLANLILHIDDNPDKDTTSALDSLKSIKSVCLTDAMFDEPILSWMKPTAPKARNWVVSALPLDTKLPKRDAISFSAGTDEHERTSSSCIKSVFKFIEESFDED